MLLAFGLPLRAITSDIDFSPAGYGGGGKAIPFIATQAVVEPSGNDDTDLIQAAISKVAEVEPDENGFRGAIMLHGVLRVSGQICIPTSGIVLRGENALLIATGQSRRSLIKIGQSTQGQPTSPSVSVTADTPAGSTLLTLSSLDGLSTGTRVAIRRPSTREWIHDLGMDQFTGNFKDVRLNWLPGSRDLAWDRTIIALDAATRTITLDAPITTALQGKYGGATLQRISQPARVHHVGLENLALRSESSQASPLDEEHAWISIQMENTENAWVCNVAMEDFVSAAVWLGEGTKNITVQDCHVRGFAGADAGWRRIGFYAGGQQILVQRCSVSHAHQPFLAGLCSAGPNVFLDCNADQTTGDSGSIESWASGVLFDRVKISGGNLVLGNLGERWQGSGWNAANSIAWNCSAEKIIAENPPGAANQNLSDPTKPSLYRAQLAARLGEKALAVLDPVTRQPPTPVAQSFATAPTGPTPGPVTTQPLTITGGRFTLGGNAVFGTASSNAWWKGQTIPARAADLGWSATRWAPGRNGPGLTEDLPELATRLAADGNSLIHVWPGLWYDRRRDSHLTDNRENADVWAPFYESPWARSGQGRAADGLSKYDLTKFNLWYWNRLRDFAFECARHDMILYHHFYNHHNLVEAAAHWAEFAWRPANCLQDTGFTEPPPFTNDGAHIGVVDQFYDVTNPVRRALHRLYIWHGLDVFADQPNVVHTLAFQFAGPLSFQQFFLDTVAEWEAVHGRRVHIALNTTKAITDAILADPTRASIVDVIDQRYWQYLPDGSLFAPDSGGKTAFREDRMAAFGKDAVPPSTPALVYKQVRDYHDRFPENAIICGHAGQGPIPIIMAGGAMPLLADYSAAQPLKAERDDRAFIHFIRDHLADTLAGMQPIDIGNGTWCLSNPSGSRQLYYSPAGTPLALAPGKNITGAGLWFNPKTGTTQDIQIKPGSLPSKPTDDAWLLLVRR